MYSILDNLDHRSDLAKSPYTSSCGHVMHAACWRKHYDDVLGHERLRNRLRHPQVSTYDILERKSEFELEGLPLIHGCFLQSFDVSKSEFLCPLCRCLSNTVIPIIPQFHVLQPVTAPSDTGR